ncbi:MAG: trypsin-like peptidase domain-containing protein [Armatimonadetes bacterium]|nr:trypsin-like peptidase domain-containing protein [Armatimonadota bacterium]
MSHRQALMAARRLLVLALLLVGAAAATGQARTRLTFLAIQERVTSLQERLIGSTVGIRTGPNSGSGVIISAEGYVLTAAHVVSGPGRDCVVRLADGREFPGQSLGCNVQADFALVKFAAPAGVTVASLGDANTLRRGQWVVATGHPLGFHGQRPPVLRVGRVVAMPRPRSPDRPSARVITDAPLISGDSGGPLFDLDGRVVGIHAMVSSLGDQPEGVSLHTAINLARGVLEALKEPGMLTEAGPPAAVQERFTRGKEALEQGRAAEAVEHLRAVLNVDANDAMAWLLLGRAYARLGRTEGALTSLERAASLGFNDSPSLRTDGDLAGLARQPRFRLLLEQMDRWAGIPGVRRSAAEMRKAAASLPEVPLTGAVRLFSGSQEVAWGLVVSSEGDVLTKASELPEGEITCVLADGRRLPAVRQRTDEKWDVALLKVPGGEVEPVRFAPTAPEPAVGQWLLTPDEAGAVAAIGAVSVAKLAITDRGLGGSPPPGSGFMGVFLHDLDVEALRQAGIPGGVRLAVEPESPAAQAGVQTGDILYQVDALRVREANELVDYVSRKKPGERLVLRMVRGETRLERAIILGARPAGIQKRNLAIILSGDVSRMQGPFAEAFQHDTALKPSQMGGPVMNADGRCVGMNIARADRTATYALPAAVVQSIYQQLKSAARG